MLRAKFGARLGVSRRAGTKMTRHEKLSVAISILALVISIASPFLNYYWFQNEVRIHCTIRTLNVISS